MLAELRVTPIGEGRETASLVAMVIHHIAASGLRYQVHAMGTTLEGELDAILDVVRTCHRELRDVVDRVLIELSIDDGSEADGEATLRRSLDRVRRYAGGIELQRL